jgi:hypothetical protein
VIFSLALIRHLLKTEPYEFVLVLMNPGVNDHVIVKGPELEFSHTHDGKDYEVKSDRLYRVKVGRLTSLWFYLRGIKKRFLIVFQHEKSKPVTAQTVKVSTRVLKKVNESRALGKALRSQFAVPMDLKKILMIIGFLVIVVIAYVIVTGEVVI